MRVTGDEQIIRTSAHGRAQDPPLRRVQILRLIDHDMVETIPGRT
jgi:hypothetical protein